MTSNTDVKKTASTTASISSEEYRLKLKNSVSNGQLNTPKSPKETKESTDTGSADIISQLQEFIDKQNRKISTTLDS